MAAIYVYSAVSKDWTGNGMSILKPLTCTVHEIAGGEYELELIHPVTSDNRWTELVTGNIIKAPVPYKTPVLLSPAGEILTKSGAVIWKIKSSSSTTNVYASMDESDVVYASLEPGTEYEYLGAMDATWHRARTSDGVTGYIKTAYGEHARDESVIAGATGSSLPALRANYQCFRIYAQEMDTKNQTITVNARHLSYDHLYTLIAPLKLEGVTGQEAVRQINANRYQKFGTISCSIGGKYTADLTLQNVIKAIMDPEIGVAQQLKGMVVRDNRDIAIKANTARNAGYTIAYGKNLIGVTWTKKDEDVVTQIIPVGQDADGNTFLLPEVSINSQYINDYPVIRQKRMDVSEAHESSEKSKDDCYNLMREAAQKELDNGCDMADFDLEVEFIHLGDTAEYAQYRGLEKLYLYDKIMITHAPTGMKLEGQLAEYEWDCLLGRYISIRIGSVFAVEGATIAGYQIASGSVNGTKLAPGSVGSLQLRELSVDRSRIGYAAIGTANIGAAVITTACIADEAVERSKIAKATITSAEIAEGTIKAANIEKGTITEAEIGRAAITEAHIHDEAVSESKILNGSITHAKMGDAAIDTANIVDMAVTTAKIADASVTDAKIANLAVGTAQIKDAAITHAKIGIAAIEEANIADASITNAKIQNASIDKAKIKEFDAVVGQISTAVIQDAHISFAKIKDLQAGVALIERSLEGKTYIRDLAVTDANISQLLTGKIVIQDREGNYRQLIVNTETGAVMTNLVEIDGGTLLDGTVDHTAIVRNSITTRELNVAEIMADEAFVLHLTAGLARFGTLFSNSAMVEQLKTHIISSDYVSIKVRQDLAWSNGTNLIRNASMDDKAVETDGEIDLGERVEIDETAYNSNNQATLRVWLNVGEKAAFGAAIEVIVPGCTAELGKMILGEAALGASTEAGYMVYGDIIEKNASGWSTVTVSLPDTAVALKAKIVNIAEHDEGGEPITDKEGNEVHNTGLVMYHAEKLEYGEIPTPWTPCPYDLEQRVYSAELAIQPETIAATVMSSEAFTNQMGGMDQLIREAKEGAIAVTDEKLKGYVSETTYNEFNEAVSKQYSEVIQTVNGFGIKIESIEGLSEIYDYLAFGYFEELGKSGLLVGKSDALMRGLFSNDRLSFYNGTNEVSYFSGDSQYIKNARVTSTLSIGTTDNGWFDWVRVGGGLGLKYRRL